VDAVHRTLMASTARSPPALLSVSPQPTPPSLNENTTCLRTGDMSSIVSFPIHFRLTIPHLVFHLLFTCFSATSDHLATAKRAGHLSTHPHTGGRYCLPPMTAPVQISSHLTIRRNTGPA
jgi:hypothetical protein